MNYIKAIMTLVNSSFEAWTSLFQTVKIVTLERREVLKNMQGVDF